MADVKLVVIYPPPKDVDALEKVYQEEHVPLAVAKLSGKTKIVAIRYSARRGVLLPSIGLRKSIFLLCKLWRRARPQKAARRHSRTR